MQKSDKSYSVVTDPNLADIDMDIPYEIEDEIDELYIKARKGKNSVKGRLQKLILRYPKLVFLRNYLIVWYEANGLTKEASKYNDETLRLYPDYIFAISYKVKELIEEERIAEAGALLKDKYDIREVHPNRKAFHISEYKAYTSAVICYLAAIGDFENAEKQIELADDAGVGDEVIENFQMMVLRYRLAKGRNRWEEQEKKRIVAQQNFQYSLPQREVVMKPMNDQFEFLYDEGSRIDEGRLKDTIESDSQLLIAELKHILKTAVEGYEFIVETEEWSHVVLHSLLLLPYLDDEITFPIVLDFFKEPEECVEYWVIDWASELLSRFFRNFSEAKLQQVYDFITDSKVTTYAKIIILELLANFTLCTPEAREHLIQTVKKLFDYFTANRDNEHLFDSDVMAFLVGAAVDLKATELLDTIRDAYAKGWVSEMIEGDFEEACGRLLSMEHTVNAVFYDDVFAHLHKILPKWQGNADDSHAMGYLDDDDFDEWEEEEDYAPFLSPAKPIVNKVIVTNPYAGTSKNAPCPCGSGKKYKRCHGK